MTFRIVWITLACIAAFLAIAASAYLGLGFATLAVFSKIFEGSGHPPMPNAPDWMYVLFLFVAWPIVSLAAGVTAGRWIWLKLRVRYR